MATVYHIDAFTDHLFSGNPAMVYCLENKLSDDLMQLIAAEHHLPVTTFIWKDAGLFTIRWFTPQYELPLCGHGCLAAGYVILTQWYPDLNEVSFHYPTAQIQLRRDGEWIEYDFPIHLMVPRELSAALSEGLGCAPVEVYCGDNERCLAIFSDEEDILNLSPNMSSLKQLSYRSIIVSAPGKEVDFVSRVFYPGKTMSEDAATGSSHCILAPYWSRRLGKPTLKARQLSQRRGEFHVTCREDHIILRGRARLYMQGKVPI